MAWMMDTYSMQTGYAVPEIVTGKPISIGGSVFRHEATGAGVVMVIERACGRLGWNLAEQRCVVQGFGNVGGIAATELHDRGARVIARLGHLGRRATPRAGSTFRTLHAYVARARIARGLRAAAVERITNEELLELPCDILVLAAREDQVTGANAGNLRCRLVAEGANGPTSIEGDAILAERGIPVLPDILTNAGGVTVSYFEWVQDLGRLFWDRDEIRRRLADKLSDAFDRVWDVSHEQGITLRDAALVAAIREVSAALEARGIYPVSAARPRRDGVRAARARGDRVARARRARRSRGPTCASCSSCDDGRLVGVVTRKTLVREVVAAGRDPETTLLGEIAERAERTRSTATMPLDEAFAVARGARPRARAGRRRRAARRRALAVGRAAAARRGRAAARARGD